MTCSQFRRPADHLKGVVHLVGDAGQQARNRGGAIERQSNRSDRAFSQSDSTFPRKPSSTVPITADSQSAQDINMRSVFGPQCPPSPEARSDGGPGTEPVDRVHLIHAIAVRTTLSGLRRGS